MGTVTATTLETLLDASDMTDATTEAIIDQAINLLNLYGAELSNMGGTAGSKTVSLESKAEGAVIEVARAVYYSFYKGLDSTTIGGMTVDSPDLLSNPVVQRTLKEAARRLTEIEVDVG